MKGKLIIIDDEVHIRKGLGKLIAEHAANWELVGEAKNGEEGLQKIRGLRPDLAIVDVRMPVMNGIQLAEQLQQSELQTKVVILTGYKDFEYAQAAVKYGVIEFLLKPSRQSEILRVLDYVFNKLQTERNKTMLNRRFLQESAIRSLFLGLPVMGEMKETIHQEVLEQDCWFITGFLDDKGKIEHTGLLQFALRNILEEALGNNGLTAFYVPVQYNVSALFVRPAGRVSPETMGRLKDTIAGLLNIHLQMHRTEAVQSVQHFAGMFEAWITAIGMKAAQPEEKQTREDIYGLQEDWVYLVMDGHADRLKDQIRLQIDKIRMDAHPIGDVKNRAVMLLVVLHSLNRKALHLPDAIDIDRDRLHVANLERREDVLDWLEAQSEQFIGRLEEWLRSNNNNIVKKAIAYIEGNYMHSCSLSDVAAHVHFNPAYLSDLFKRETGEGFIKFVTGVRIEQAKILLKNTDLKIVEISRRVGYDDPNYFTTIFSKMNHCSPNQYRKRTSDVK